MNTQYETDIYADDILAIWKQGRVDIDWRELTIKGKEEWQTACLEWSGLPTEPVKAGIYTINGYGLLFERDFFCLVSEVFGGYRGYFGRCVHGFYDCFCEIARQNPMLKPVESGVLLRFENSATIKEVLDYDTYDYFVETIERLRITLQIDS